MLCKAFLFKNWTFLTLAYTFFIITPKNSKLKKVEFISNKSSELWKLNFKAICQRRVWMNSKKKHFWQLNTAVVHGYCPKIFLSET